MRRDALAIAALSLAIVTAADSARAQLASTSAAALGLGDAYTAGATGHDAIAWNPAALAWIDDGRVSLALAPVGIAFGAEPVSVREIAEAGGTVLSTLDKAKWLLRIRDAGGQHGTAGAELTYGALRIGPVGIRIASRVAGRIDLSAEAAELLLFGNAGRTGEPRDFELEGGGIDLAATSSVAIAYGRPVPLPIDALRSGTLAVGTTLRFRVGHGLLVSRDAGSALHADPLRIHVAFPTLHSTSGAGPIIGHGVALDVGLLWRTDRWRIALVGRDLVDTFAWDDDALRYRAGWALFEFGGTGAETDLDPRPVDEAPAALRLRADAAAASPAAALGVAVRVRPALTLSFDLRRRFGDPRVFGARTHLGGGIEYRPAPWLPLRAGLAARSDGYRGTIGLGLHARAIRVDVAAARRVGRHAAETAGLISAAYHWR